MNKRPLLVLALLSLVTALRAAPTIATTSNRDITNDAFSPTSSITIVGSSSFVVGDPLNLFGAAINSIPGDSDDVLFQNAPIGTTYFVNWKTAAPVVLSSYRVVLSDDAPSNNRAIMQLRLFSSTDASFTTLTLLSSATIASPYSAAYGGSVIAVTDSFTPVTAQYFRVEFVNASVSGPRLIEIDGNIAVVIDTTDAALGLEMALAQREILLHVDRLATRDLNGHLFRLRAGEDQEVEETAPALQTGGKEILLAGRGGKEVLSRAEPELAFRRFSFFADGDFGRVEQDDIHSTRGFRGDTYSGSVGLEYRATRTLRLGLGGTYLDNNTKLGGNLGKTEVSGEAIAAYASWVQRHFYVDGVYSFGRYEHEIHRLTFTETSLSAAPSSNNHVGSLNTGYNFNCARLVFGPYATLDYYHGNLDGYTEKGSTTAAIAVGSQSYDSLNSRLGCQASYRIKTPFGAIVPQIHADWVREYLDQSDLIRAQLVGTAFSVSKSTPRPGADYIGVGGGLLAQINDCCSVVADVEDQVARQNRSDFFASVRIAAKF